MKKTVQIMFSLGLSLVLLWTVLIPALKVRAAEEITSVSIDLDEPEAGCAPDYEPDLPWGADYYSADYNTDSFKHDMFWYDETDSSYVDVTDDDFLYGYGHVYSATIYLTAKEGFQFADGCTAEVNGNQAECSVSGNGQLRVDYTFPKTKKAITSVSMTVDAPIAGAFPDWSPEFPSNAHYQLEESDNDLYVVSGVYWVDLTATNYMFVNSTTYQLQHEYKITVTLYPKSGYQFTDQVTAKVNGKTAEVRHEFGYLLVSYQFPKITTSIITTQPENVSATEGKTATFKVVASGSNLSYQWYYQKPGESYSWTMVSINGTSATYSLTTAARHNGYTYRCRVTSDGKTVYSNTAKLTVRPGITTQPSAVTVKEGKKATFKVVASGTGLTYQWQYKKPGATSYTNVSKNGTSATYSLTAEARHNGYVYRCKVTNSGGGTRYSATAKLTVRPTITTQPSAVTVKAGAKATFKVVASGTGLTYQWQYKKPGETTWNNVSVNGTSATYSLTTAARHNGYVYRCKVTNSGGGYVYSSSVKLTVK